MFVSNELSENDRNDIEPSSNWRLDRSTNYNINGLNDRYIELNNILREQEERVALNNLVSECLFLDQAAGHKEQRTKNMKWADTTQQSLASRIGNTLKSSEMNSYTTFILINIMTKILLKIFIF